jgi:multiple sugar transport system permease protein
VTDVAALPAGVGRGSRALGRQTVSRRVFDKLTPLFFLAPALITLAVWHYWPLIESFRLSFYEWNLLPTSPPVLVGLENYRRLLELPEMGIAALNTVFYTLGLLPMTVALPLAVALSSRGIGGRAGAIYRALIFMPMIIAPVVVAVLWRWLLNPDHGAVNQALGLFGLSPIAFLQDPRTALLSILFITGWKLVGFSALLFAAAIANIDRALIEAARLDGASEWQVSWRIFVPLLSPVIALIATLTLLHGAQWSFVYINVLTQGGPLQATTNLYYLLWDYGFGNFAIGWSTAAGMVLFAVFGAVALLSMHFSRSRIHFES